MIDAAYVVCLQAARLVFERLAVFKPTGVRYREEKQKDKAGQGSEYWRLATATTAASQASFMSADGSEAEAEGAAGAGAGAGAAARMPAVVLAMNPHKQQLLRDAIGAATTKYGSAADPCVWRDIGREFSLAASDAQNVVAWARSGPWRIRGAKDGDAATMDLLDQDFVVLPPQQLREALMMLGEYVGQTMEVGAWSSGHVAQDWRVTWLWPMPAGVVAHNSWGQCL